MSELTNKIEEYYATLRSRAESKAEACLRRALQNEDFPEIERNYQSSRIRFLRSHAELPAKIEECKREFLKWKEKRNSSLSMLGIREEDLIPSYTCKKCSDTGFMEDGYACTCYKDLLHKLQLEEMGITPISFSSFEKANKELTPYIPFEYYEKKYCDVFPNVPLSTVFSGATGTGKTFLAACIGEKLDKEHKEVLFLSSFSLNRFFMACFEKETYKTITTLFDCDLLIIDDLGTEPIYRKITLEYFKLILDERFDRKKPVIITTNLSKEDILSRYGERIYSRIFDQSSLDYNDLFRGKDLRTK